jgi:hypothetical protein
MGLSYPWGMTTPLPKRIKDRRTQAEGVTRVGRVIAAARRKRLVSDDPAPLSLEEVVAGLSVINEALWFTCAEFGAEVDSLRGRIGALERRIGR